MSFLKFFTRILSNRNFAFFVTFVIFVLCTLPSKNVPLAHDINDKTAHFVAFAAWAFCWQFAFSNSIATLVLGVLYGVLIECWQGSLPEDFHRGFDWYDALADGIGVIIGITLFNIQEWLFKILLFNK